MTETTTNDAALTVEDLHDLAQQLRVDAVRAVAAANSGHATSSLSAADLVAVLAARHLRYDFLDPDHPGNDRLIFSKGHASPLLYALYRACGAIDQHELVTFRCLHSRIEGHPTPRLRWVDVATGSLGQGLPVGVGMALAGRHLDHLPSRVWVLCGDSEMAEGSMWEAFETAGHRRLDNLCAIVDVNRLGQRGETMHGWDLAAYTRRAAAFGWHTVEVDGHDIDALDVAFAEAVATDDRPTLIAARTIKGKGVASVEDQPGYHGRPLPDPRAAIDELGGIRHRRIHVTRPPDVERKARRRHAPTLPAYEPGVRVATRTAYGDALAAVVTARGDLVVLDAEVANSTCTDAAERAAPERFLQLYIAEQQMVAAAVGLHVMGWTPIAATFAAFWSRAADFVRMAAISQATLALCGSHAGVSIGEDGPSQMGLEDLATLRAVHGSTVVYPCDANQTVALVATLADQAGISYLRTTRGATPVLYPPGTAFPIGGSRLLRGGTDDDAVTIVAAGITVHEALTAADTLAAAGIAVRVIDAYSIKPIDRDTLRDAARVAGGRLVVAEDHRPEGGLGDAVLDALADADIALRLTKLAVRHLPGSATPTEQLAAAGIDATAIAAACRALLDLGSHP
jgi:transketolase